MHVPKAGISLKQNEILTISKNAILPDLLHEDKSDTLDDISDFTAPLRNDSWFDVLRQFTK